MFFFSFFFIPAISGKGIDYYIHRVLVYFSNFQTVETSFSFQSTRDYQFFEEYITPITVFKKLFKKFLRSITLIFSAKG